MILIGLVLLASSPAPAWVDPCPKYSVQIYQAAAELYANPSNRNRIRVTRRMKKSVLMPLRDVEVIQRPEMGRCFSFALHSIGTFADEVTLAPALDPQHAVYEQLRRKLFKERRASSEYFQVQKAVDSFSARSNRSRPVSAAFFEPRLPQRRPAAANAAFLRKVRAACVGTESSEASCPRWWIYAALRAGEVNIRPHIERERHPLKHAMLGWIDLHAKFADRRQRLEAALRYDGQPEVQVYVRRWALDELLGDYDPREWDPADIALVVHAAREEDKAAFAVQSNRGLGSAPISYFPTQCEGVLGIHRCRVQDYLSRLNPLGVHRVFELVQPKSVVPLEDTTVRVSGDSDTAVFYYGEHFIGEARRYQKDFYRQDRGFDRQRLQRREAYLRSRWLETDARAPTPNLKRVREILSKWDEHGHP